jgi:hypothetical protein
VIEQELESMGYTEKFLQTLFRLKCEDNIIKVNDAKYAVFLNGFYKKMKGNNKLVLLEHNLREKSLNYMVE